MGVEQRVIELAVSAERVDPADAAAVRRLREETAECSRTVGEGPPLADRHADDPSGAGGGLDLVRREIDALWALVERTLAGGRVVLTPGAGERDLAIEFASEARMHVATAEQCLLGLSGENDAASLAPVLRALHTVKGIAGFLRMDQVIRLTSAGEELAIAVRRRGGGAGERELDLLLETCDLLGELVGTLQGRSGVDRLRLERVVLGLGRAAAVAERMRGEPAMPRACALQPPERKEGEVRVSAAALEELSRELGSLRAEAVSNGASSSIVDGLDRMAHLVASFQRVSLEEVFGRARRLAGDVAARCGRAVSVHIKSGRVTVDRPSAEVLSRVLLHLIHNACDHGIESSTERLEAGKPASGNLWICAKERGGAVEVEVSDDGRGIDRARVLRAAAERGLLPRGRSPESMSDSEVYELLFLPGMTTRETVSEISGRGVGMDVVRDSLEAIGGEVEVESALGRGTTVRLRLPAPVRG